MIGVVNSALHQDAMFLIKSDMAAHQIMQAMMRQVAREFASSDLIAASLLARSIARTDAVQGADQRIENLYALSRDNQLNYPLVLKHGVEQFGFCGFKQQEEWKSAPQEHTDSSCQDKPDTDDGNDDLSLSEEDMAVFYSVDKLMTNLQDQSLCAGMQLGLYNTSPKLTNFWRDSYLAILMPIGGRLGSINSVFIFLLRKGFEPRSIQGRVTMDPGNPVRPLPCQSLQIKHSAELVSKSCLHLDGVDVMGKSFLLGLIRQLPPVRHWLDLDHRDMD